MAGPAGTPGAAGGKFDKVPRRKHKRHGKRK